MHVRKWDYAYGRPVVSEIVGPKLVGSREWLLHCPNVRHIHRAHFTDLRDSPLCICASTNHIRLTAGCYRSIALIIITVDLYTAFL